MPGLQGPIVGLRGPSQAQEGPSNAREVPFESKVGEKTLVFIFGWELIDQGPLAPLHVMSLANETILFLTSMGMTIAVKAFSARTLCQQSSLHVFL